MMNTTIDNQIKQSTALSRTTEKLFEMAKNLSRYNKQIPIYEEVTDQTLAEATRSSYITNKGGKKYLVYKKGN